MMMPLKYRWKDVFLMFILAILPFNLYAEYDDEPYRKAPKENEYLEELEQAYMSIAHKPIIVKEGQFESMVVFFQSNFIQAIQHLPSKQKEYLPDTIHYDGAIYNIRLSDKKIQYVGSIFCEEILSVFIYRYQDSQDKTLYVLGRSQEAEGVYRYSIYDYPIIKEETGLFIHWFPAESKYDTFTNCIEGGLDYFGEPRICPFKDAASIKRFLDGER